MSGLALQLKEHTREAHSSAENQSFQVALGQGTLSLPTYRRYLSQLLLIHDELESQIRKHNLAEVVTDEQLQTPWLKQDLDVLGATEDDKKAISSTNELLDAIKQTAETEPVALVGYHYVLLGSKHGGKFIAATMKKSLNLDGGGTKYFDPYGPEFQKHWQGFVAALNGLEPTEAQTEATLKAARVMFDGIGRVGQQLQAESESA